MKIDNLIKKLYLYDKNGEIINELIKQKILSTEDITDYVCKSNNYDLILYISNYVSNIDINILEDKILNTYNTKLILKYAINAKKINIKKFENKILEIGKSKDIVCFAINLHNKYKLDLASFEDALLKRGDINEIFAFVRTIPNLNYNKLVDFIISKKDAKDICEFTIIINKVVKNFDNNKINIITKLTNEVLKSGDISLIAHLNRNIGFLTPLDIINLVKNNNLDYKDYLDLIYSSDSQIEEYLYLNTLDYLSLDTLYDVSLVKLYSPRRSNTLIDLVLNKLINKSITENNSKYLELILDITEVVECNIDKILKNKIIGAIKIIKECQSNNLNIKKLKKQGLDKKD